MSINKTYAVLGLGRYGKAVAEELVNNGAEVLAVDIDQNNVNNAIETIPVCKCADITEPEAIKRLGISNIDVVIVAMASNSVTNCNNYGDVESTSYVVGGIVGNSLKLIENCLK